MLLPVKVHHISTDGIGHFIVWTNLVANVSDCRIYACIEINLEMSNFNSLSLQNMFAWPKSSWIWSEKKSMMVTGQLMFLAVL